MAKIHITLTNDADAVFECIEYAMGDRVFSAIIRKRADGEPEQVKLFPLCNILELTITDAE